MLIRTGGRSGSPVVNICPPIAMRPISEALKPVSRSAQKTISGTKGNSGRPVKYLTLVATVSFNEEKALSATTALIFGFWKVFKPNFWIQNLTEIFVYGGLAAIFVPVFNMFSVSILLILISIYDIYAVWKSKHMVTLAKSQMKAKVFAGILIPYQPIKSLAEKKLSGSLKKIKVRTAILGGGDIGFPLIFAGVVMKDFGLWQSLIIPVFALLGLAALLFTAKEKKFYPAMPFISAGCFLGLLVVWVIGLFL